MCNVFIVNFAIIEMFYKDVLSYDHGRILCVLRLAGNDDPRRKLSV